MPTFVEDKPLLLDAYAAAALCHVTARTWQMWNAAAKVPPPIRIGRKTLWRSGELRIWIEAGCPPRNHWRYVPNSGKSHRG